MHESWNRRPRAMAHADRLAEALDLDMAAEGWTPTVDNYFGRVTKARILQAVAEAKGQRAADRIEHLKKGEMAETAAALLADGGWLPEPLRTLGRSVTPSTEADADLTPVIERSATDGGITAMVEVEPTAEDGPVADSPHAMAAE